MLFIVKIHYQYWRRQVLSVTVLFARRLESVDRYMFNCLEKTRILFCIF